MDDGRIGGRVEDDWEVGGRWNRRQWGLEGGRWLWVEAFGCIHIVEHIFYRGRI